MYVAVGRFTSPMMNGDLDIGKSPPSFETRNVCLLLLSEQFWMETIACCQKEMMCNKT